MVGGKLVRVRPAKPSDQPRLVEIARHSVTAAQWTEGEYLKLFIPEEAQARTEGQDQGQPQNQLESRTALVLEQDRAVVGFIVGRQVAEEWEIENIAVTGAARRRGLGSRLLGEWLNHVRKRGGKTVLLEVRESNRAARSLYEKWAFVEVGRRKSYYQNPVEDALILRFNFS